MQKEEKEITKWRKYPNAKPENCAMMIIDMQNDFINENGRYADWGIDISHMVRTVEPIKKVINFCREMNIPIIAARFIIRDLVEYGIGWKIRPLIVQGGLREGSWGVEIIDELEISSQKGDWIIDRPRFSCFFSTRLELLLRGLNRKTLIVTGVLTNQCVESTIRDAQMRDFEVLELLDCVGTMGGTMMDPITREKAKIAAEELHCASLRAVTFGLGDVIPSQELIGELGKISK